MNGKGRGATRPPPPPPLPHPPPLPTPNAPNSRTAPINRLTLTQRSTGLGLDAHTHTWGGEKGAVDDATADRPRTLLSHPPPPPPSCWEDQRRPVGGRAGAAQRRHCPLLSHTALAGSKCLLISQAGGQSASAWLGDGRSVSMGWRRGLGTVHRATVVCVCVYL